MAAGERCRGPEGFPRGPVQRSHVGRQVVRVGRYEIRPVQLKGLADGLEPGFRGGFDEDQDRG